MRNKLELKQLALEASEGKVVGTWSLKPIEVPLTFPILVMAGHEVAEQMQANATVHVYEYLDKSGATQKDTGLPVFMSCHQMNLPEFNDFQFFLNEVASFRAAFLADSWPT